MIRTTARDRPVATAGTTPPFGRRRSPRPRPRAAGLLFALALADPVVAQTPEPVRDSTTDAIDARRPVFGGACRLCPWGALGEAVRQAMAPYGYQVRMCYNCNAAAAPLIVADARVPPPQEPAPGVPDPLAPRNEPGLGPVDFGATAVQFMVGAYRGEGLYARHGARPNLRLIANIQSPNYLVVAARSGTGVTDLAEIREKRWPVRILAGGAGGEITGTILTHFGLSVQAIEDAGGGIGTGPEFREDFDIIIHSSEGLTTAPEFDVWTEVSQRFDLTYIQLPEELLARLAESDWYHPGMIPVGLLHGVDRAIPTVVRTGTVVYTRDDVPDEFAYDVAKALDEQQQLLQWSHLPFSYNPYTVWKAYEVPLHPGAERYYRERGYLK